MGNFKKMLVSSLVLLIFSSALYAEEERDGEHDFALKDSRALEVAPNLTKEQERKLVKITAEDAIKSAQQRVSGRVFNVELENQDGNLLYTVSTTDSDGKNWNIAVHPITGEVLEVKRHMDLTDVRSKIQELGELGYGISLYPSVAVAAVDVSPFKTAINSDITKNGVNSPFYNLPINSVVLGDYETFFSIGGGGVIGVGKGFRVGGAGYALLRNYDLKRSNTDSLYKLSMTIGYGGVILEKAFDIKRSSIIIGGLIGAGEMAMTLENDGIDNDTTEEVSDNNSDSSSNNDENIDSENDDELYDSSAKLFVGDIHLGYTFSILEWLHIGANATTTILHSKSGFTGSDSFTTYNPSFGLKIIFGNLR